MESEYDNYFDSDGNLTEEGTTYKNTLLSKEPIEIFINLRDQINRFGACCDYKIDYNFLKTMFYIELCAMVSDNEVKSKYIQYVFDNVINYIDRLQTDLLEKIAKSFLILSYNTYEEYEKIDI